MMTAQQTSKTSKLSANGVLWLLVAILVESARIVSCTFRKSHLSTVQPLAAKGDSGNIRQSRSVVLDRVGECSKVETNSDIIV